MQKGDYYAGQTCRPGHRRQQRKWAAESPLAQDISAILVNHPEYYDEIRAHIGEVFANPNT
jgi:hypothetical protein